MSDRIKEIRARHQAATWRLYELKSQIHDDREMLLAEVDRLTRERDEARAKSAKMREALRKFECMCIGDQCDSYGQPYQPQCERDIARKLVEGKP